MTPTVPELLEQALAIATTVGGEAYAAAVRAAYVQGWVSAAAAASLAALAAFLGVKAAGYASDPDDDGGAIVLSLAAIVVALAAFVATRDAAQGILAPEWVAIGMLVREVTP